MKILEFATSITTPITLIALFFLGLLAIYKIIVKLDIFPILTKKDSAKTINNIINKLFWLVLAMMIIYGMKEFYISTQSINKTSCIEYEKNITLKVGDSKSILNKNSTLYLAQADETTCTLNINSTSYEITMGKPLSIPIETCEYTINIEDYNSQNNSCNLLIKLKG